MPGGARVATVSVVLLAVSAALAAAESSAAAEGSGTTAGTKASSARSAPARSQPQAPRTARAPRTGLPGGYAAAVRTWHTKPEGAHAPRDTAGRPLLVLAQLNTREHLTLQAVRDDGGFRTEDLERASGFLRDTRTGNEHPVEPRLLEVAYRIQKRFDAPELRILSAYRTPRGRRASNHGRGRALDLIVPGAANEEVARFARELGFVGVGVYPTSGFLHVDVRDRSYFWVDTSGPGRRSRERGILGDVAKRSDAAALARGERGLGPFFVAGDVDGTLKYLGALPVAPASSDEDDDHDQEGDGAD